MSGGGLRRLSGPALQPLLVVLLASALHAQQQCSEWNLLWADEFDGPLQLSNWEVQTGNGCQYGAHGSTDMCGWGNGELQDYRPQNVWTEGGRLVIEARREADGALTSARIRTLGRFAIAPSAAYKTIKVEASMQLPQGTGLWPAFWMLPWADPLVADPLGSGDYGGWPASGEIDIAEGHGGMEEVVGSLHYGDEAPSGRVNRSTAALPDGGSLAGGFHTYTLEWEANHMRWFLDGVLYNQMESSYGTHGANGGWWTGGPGASANSPFDQPFYIILNLALGGAMTSYAPAEQVTSMLEEGSKRMLVEYVRVSGRPWT